MFELSILSPEGQIFAETVDEVLESWCIKRKADLFTDVFGYKVMIVGK